MRQKKGHIIHGKVRVTIWRVRVMWVTIWYLNMNYLPSWKGCFVLEEKPLGTEMSIEILQ